MSEDISTQQIQLPFAPQIQKFIDAFVNSGDLEEAAIHAGYPREMGARLFKRRAVAAEINRRKGNVENQIDKIVAQRRIVEVSNLDRQLNRVVNISTKDMRATPALAASKVKAIELGYRRVGLMVDENFIPDSGSVTASSAQESARIFRATEMQMLTHRVETTQTVTTRVVEAPTPQSAKPPLTIDADNWDKF